MGSSDWRGRMPISVFSAIWLSSEGSRVCCSLFGNAIIYVFIFNAMVKKKHVELAKVATIHTGSRISLFWKKKKKDESVISHHKY